MSSCSCGESHEAPTEEIVEAEKSEALDEPVEETSLDKHEELYKDMEQTLAKLKEVMAYLEEMAGEEKAEGDEEEEEEEEEAEPEEEAKMEEEEKAEEEEEEEEEEDDEANGGACGGALNGCLACAEFDENIKTMEEECADEE